jgi:hypothetical protein
VQEAALWEILKLEERRIGTRVQRLRRAVFIYRFTLESKKVWPEDVEIFQVICSTLTVYAQRN